MYKILKSQIINISLVTILSKIRSNLNIIKFDQNGIVLYALHGLSIWNILIELVYEYQKSSICANYQNSNDSF